MCTHPASDRGKAETKPIKTETGSLCLAPIRYTAKLREILNTIYFLFCSVFFWRAVPVRELNGNDQQVRLSSCRPVLSWSSWTSWTGITGPQAGWCHCLQVILFREVTGSSSKWTVCYLKHSAAPGSREHQTPPFGSSASPLSRHSVFFICPRRSSRPVPVQHADANGPGEAWSKEVAVGYVLLHPH